MQIFFCIKENKEINNSIFIIYGNEICCYCLRHVKLAIENQKKKGKQKIKLNNNYGIICQTVPK